MEEIELPEAVSGLQLQRALELLIDRLLARPERRERALRTLRLGARFVERGTWRREVPLRQASVSRERLRLALVPRLDELPAPIEQLSLTVVAFGPPVADQLSFQRPDEQERRNRLAEALRQTRAAAGSESVLRVLEVEPGLARAGAARVPDPVPGMSQWPAPLPPPARDGRRPGADGIAGEGRARARRVAARGVAGRGPLVDGAAVRRRYFELTLDERRERGRVLRPRQRALVLADGRVT